MPRPRKSNLTSTDYKREFNKANYDRIELTVPKGQKQAIKAHAESKGKSINEYANGLIRADMGLSEWPERAEEHQEAH